MMLCWVWFRVLNILVLMDSYGSCSYEYDILGQILASSVQ
jgi:hypothetical protein